VPAQEKKGAARATKMKVAFALWNPWRAALVLITRSKRARAWAGAPAGLGVSFEREA